MKYSDDWDTGVAFVRGLNIYRNARISQKEMLELCRKVESRNLKILGVLKTDNIIFKKRNMHYATVGSKLEKILSEHFGKRIYVTTRSTSTIRLLSKKIYKNECRGNFEP